MKKYIRPLEIKEYSGFIPKVGSINVAKRHQYFIIPNVSITGDAPKDFISYYHYGDGTKINSKSWPKFIAKHGHKHYPAEAITEYLLNQIGEVLGFNMAKSELAWFGTQIRFLSKYFLMKPKQQILNHGADLYAGYLNDREFVEEIEKKHKSSEFFTVEFTEETIKYFYPNECNELMLEFYKMLIFDAIIGNNDRHFYNWGIIQDIENNTKPIFSPIYDTARGLFWNTHDDIIDLKMKNPKDLDRFIKKYCNDSTPKIGWDGTKISHFDLVQHLIELDQVRNCELIRNVCSNNNLQKLFQLLDDKFSLLFSSNRIELIKRTLKYRFETIQKIYIFAKC